MIGNLKFLAAAAMLSGLLGAMTPQTALAQTREITQVKDNLYIFRNDAHIAAFLVTSDGVIATDPINADAARWLEAEVKSRFDQEIKYLIYSHSDADHVSGGEVFEDTATIVAHENAAPIIAAGDYTAAPDETFADTKTVELGGERVVLHYFGPSHTDNLIVMEFPATRAIFVVDTLNINRLPYRDLPGFYMPEIIDVIRRIQSLDYEIAIPGHGGIGGREDVARYCAYLEALFAAVKDARARGLSLSEAQAEILLEDFSDFANYEAWRALNIEGVYRILDESA